MNKKLQIVIFTYNFPHKKSCDFIDLLVKHRVIINLIIAANFVKINETDCNTNKDKSLHPMSRATKYRIPFKVAPHNSHHCVELLREFNINFGIIAGARILQSNVINQLRYGVLNFHPAILPMVRGLDAVLWTINKNLSIGVTAHLINEKIDLGYLVCSDKIVISSNDNLETMLEKNYQLQLKLIPIALNLIFESRTFPLIQGGDYNTKMSEELRNNTIGKIKNYVKEHARKN